MSGAPSRLPALTVTVARFAAVPGMTLALPPATAPGRRHGAGAPCRALTAFWRPLRMVEMMPVPIAQTQMTAPTGKAVVADGGTVTVTGLP